VLKREREMGWDWGEEVGGRTRRRRDGGTLHMLPTKYPTNDLRQELEEIAFFKH
jgi:hypothetical protein